MKIVAVLGSPHEDGFSSTLANEVLRGAAAAGHEITTYEINKMNVQGCQGCGHCRNNKVDCVIQDDLKPYWNNLHECDALVVSSPNYYSQVTGPMITYMNRHYCLTDKAGDVRIHAGIKIIGVFSQGNSNPDAYKAQYSWFLSSLQKQGMVLGGMLIHAGNKPLDADCELMRQAYKIGNTL